MKRWKMIFFLALAIVLSINLLIIYNTYFIRLFKQESKSMEPVLKHGARVLVNCYVYSMGKFPILGCTLPFTHHPRRGEIAVYWFPRDPTKVFVHRIIAVPDDKLRITAGVIFVNGKQVDDSHIPGSFQSKHDQEERTVPAGYYFCAGDHRNRSYDSRYWGYVPRRYFIGKAFYSFGSSTENGWLKLDHPFFVKTD